MELEGSDRFISKDGAIDSLVSFAEFVLIIAVAIILAVIIQTSGSRPRGVIGTSMLPTYNNYQDYASGTVGDTVYITRFSTIRRGDVIVFENPESGNNNLLIKRVIGIAGDTVNFQEIPGTGKVEVLLNGEALTEGYINATSAPQKTEMDGNINRIIKQGGVKVPSRCYFVMGDNRVEGASKDSRSFGVVNYELVEGKVYLKVAPGENFLGSVFRAIFGGKAVRQSYLPQKSYRFAPLIVCD